MPSDSWPIGMTEAAERLGKSKRWLQEYLRKNPAGRMAGRTRLFTEEDFAALLRSLPLDRGAPQIKMSTAVRPKRPASSLPGAGGTWTERTRQRIREQRERKLKAQS